MRGHISEVEFEHYIQGRMTAESREQIELHLIECEACLRQFIEVETAMNLALPLPDMNVLEDRVISQLAREHPASSPSRRIRWSVCPAVHYFIAASITLFLLSNGTFSDIAEKLAELEQREAAESWSDQMVNKAGTWLDELKESRFREAGVDHE